MHGSQPGCEETRFTGDEKPAPWLAALDLTKNSVRAVASKMRLTTIVTLVNVACGLAPTKVSRCVENDRVWAILKLPKEQPA